MVLIPFPKKLEKKCGFFHMTQTTEILLDPSCNYTDFEAARTLQQEIVDRTGIKPNISKGLAVLNEKNMSGNNGLIRLVKSIPNSKGQECENGGEKIPAYRLTVEEGLVNIEGDGGTGLFYGIQTLRQLVRNSAAVIPCMEIEDMPDFDYRGFYHDTTRGRIPTLDTLKELADRLSFYKINQLQLYIEHSFAFKGHSEIWADSDPFTAEEILILDQYCKDRGIELVPSMSTFGHLFHALTSISFRHLNEYENIADGPFLWSDRMMHHTLNVSDPESLQFVYTMIDEFLPLFTSDKFNICCDETFDLGEGRNKSLADEVGKGKLYLYFANQIIRYVKSRGKNVMMWGDILLNHPELLPEVPEDVTILNWDYSPNVAEENIRSVAQTGLKQYVCPGVQGWNRLMNDMDAATKNIGAMAAYARKYHAQGILNTDWGDFGHINSLACSIPGAIYGAGVSWSGGDLTRPSDEEISILEYGESSGRLVGLLRDLSRQTVLNWRDVVFWYYNANGMDMERYRYSSDVVPMMMNSEESKIKASYGRILEIRCELSNLYGRVNGKRLNDMDEFLVAADGSAIFQSLLLVIKKRFLGQTKTGLLHEPKELAVMLEHWLAAYKKVWRERNRESELYRIKDVILGICRLLRS